MVYFVAPLILCSSRVVLDVLKRTGTNGASSFITMNDSFSSNLAAQFILGLRSADSSTGHLPTVRR